jgi:hypothetical protein
MDQWALPDEPAAGVVSRVDVVPARVPAAADVSLAALELPRVPPSASELTVAVRGRSTLELPPTRSALLGVDTPPPGIVLGAAPSACDAPPTPSGVELSERARDDVSLHPRAHKLRNVTLARYICVIVASGRVRKKEILPSAQPEYTSRKSSGEKAYEAHVDAAELRKLRLGCARALL